MAGCRPVTVKDATPSGNTSAYTKPGERSQRYLSTRRFSKCTCEEAPFLSQHPLSVPYAKSLLQAAVESWDPLQGDGVVGEVGLAK